MRERGRQKGAIENTRESQSEKKWEREKARERVGSRGREGESSLECERERALLPFLSPSDPRAGKGEFERESFGKKVSAGVLIRETLVLALLGVSFIKTLALTLRLPCTPLRALTYTLFDKRASARVCMCESAQGCARETERARAYVSEWVSVCVCVCVCVCVRERERVRARKSEKGRARENERESWRERERAGGCV